MRVHVVAGVPLSQVKATDVIPKEAVWESAIILGFLLVIEGDPGVALARTRALSKPKHQQHQQVNKTRIKKACNKIAMVSSA